MRAAIDRKRLDALLKQCHVGRAEAIGAAIDRHVEAIRELMEELHGKPMRVLVTHDCDLIMINE